MLGGAHGIQQAMSTDDFELLLTREGDARPIRNLWPLYLHDISANDGRAPNGLGA